MEQENKSIIPQVEIETSDEGKAKNRMEAYARELSKRYGVQIKKDNEGGNN